MRDKRKKSLDWFYRQLDAYGAHYEMQGDSVVVTAANQRTMLLSAYDLEKLSRRALTKRFERLATSA